MRKVRLAYKNPQCAIQLRIVGSGNKALMIRNAVPLDFEDILSGPFDRPIQAIGSITRLALQDMRHLPVNIFKISSPGWIDFQESDFLDHLDSLAGSCAIIMLYPASAPGDSPSGFLYNEQRKGIPMAKKLLLSLVVLVLLAAGVGPFLVPVPPVPGAKTPAQLADPDSRFIMINEITFHYKISGEGDPALILMHGFGASTFSWERVIEPLAAYGRVIAYDRPAFGLTERPLDWQGTNPYSTQAQVDQLLGLMDVLAVDQAVLIGNSAGGRIAFEAALQQPDRILAVIAVDAAVYSEGSTTDWIKPLLRTPQMRHLGPLIARRIQENGDEIIRRAWHDPSLLTEEDYLGYHKPLQIADWDRSLWELSAAPGIKNLPDRIIRLTQPVLVITGDDDRIVPTENSLRLARELPNSVLAVFPDCGHVPQEECPELFLDAVSKFLIEISD